MFFVRSCGACSVADPGSLFGKKCKLFVSHPRTKRVRNIGYHREFYSGLHFMAAAIFVSSRDHQLAYRISRHERDAEKFRQCARAGCASRHGRTPDIYRTFAQGSARRCHGNEEIMRDRSSTAMTLCNCRGSSYNGGLRGKRADHLDDICARNLRRYVIKHAPL